jgi:threonine synthase
MKFRSTKGRAPQVGFSQAIQNGLAPDGGLYVPENFPAFDLKKFDRIDDLTALAPILFEPFLAGDPLHSALGEICRGTFKFPCPLVETKGGFHLLELFHGPTAAFKDFGARFLAQCVLRLGIDPIILVATSGDTGGAVASAFENMRGVDVHVLFPEKGVSPRQKHQLTCWDSNIHSYAVQGNFDQCQAMVKKVFDGWNKKRPLSSANSINVGRLLPQMAYYSLASLRLWRKTGKKTALYIPTGNVGNATAALWARKVGFPIDKIHMSFNANRVVVDYMATGQWRPTASIATVANAMDVGNPSNMERVFDLIPDPRDPSAGLKVISVSDAEIKKVIGEAYKNWGVLACPHTATAIKGYIDSPQNPAVVVATAHPAKFQEVVEPAASKVIELPPSLSAIQSRPEKFTVIPPQVDALLRTL